MGGNSIIDSSSKTIGLKYPMSNIFIFNHPSLYNRTFASTDAICFIIDDRIRYCNLGNIKDSYRILKDEINSRNPRNLVMYAECVQNTILKYFGNMSNVEKRMLFYPSESDVRKGKERAKISDMAHKDAASDIERAIIAQNLLFDLGFTSTFKVSKVSINGKSYMYAYNLVRHDGKNYIFDATNPTVKEGRISPLICEIPNDIYVRMSQLGVVGTNIMVSHDNPLIHANVNIVYDGEWNILEENDNKVIS